MGMIFPGAPPKADFGFPLKPAKRGFRSQKRQTHLFCFPSLVVWSPVAWWCGVVSHLPTTKGFIQIQTAGLQTTDQRGGLWRFSSCLPFEASQNGGYPKRTTSHGCLRLLPGPLVCPIAGCNRTFSGKLWSLWSTPAR